MAENKRQNRSDPMIVDQAYDAIRTMIVRNQLRPGEKTSVISLGRHTGFGRTPVKEAITRLATEGLVTVRERSGTFVAQPDQRDIEQMFDVRRMLESFAARLAVGRATHERVARMEEYLRQMHEESIEKPPGKRSVGLFIDADLAFHEEIIAAADNRYLLRQYRTLNLQMQIITYLFHVGGNSAKLRQHEHAAILDAFRREDMKMLEAALVDHADAVQEAILNSFADRHQSSAVPATPQDAIIEAACASQGETTKDA